MILSQKARDWEASEAAATQLIDDDAAVRQNHYLMSSIQDNRFLLGLSVYGSHHHDWIAYGAALKNPNQHEDTQLVVEALNQTEITSREMIN